jgi:hypothetical protein
LELAKLVIWLTYPPCGPSWNYPSKRDCHHGLTDAIRFYLTEDGRLVDEDGEALDRHVHQPAPPEIAPQDIIFEDGRAVVSLHVHVEVPVSTMRLTFADGHELDIFSDVEFVGLSGEEFRVAYDAFLKTQAELRGLKGRHCRSTANSGANAVCERRQRRCHEEADRRNNCTE